ncbi:MAG: glycosyltransferase [Nitrospirae bacterium]|nr:glycosyltransferase [Nitrospirota bacterium]
MSVSVNNDSFLLVQTKTGCITLKVRGEDMTEKTLHSLYDPVDEARGIVEAFQYDGKGLLIVLGLGLGYHVNELYGRFSEAKIVVVEKLPEVYELAKKHVLHDDAQKNVSFLIGFDAEDIMPEITRVQLSEGIPPISVFALSSVVGAFPRYYGPILNRLENTVSARLNERLRYAKFKEESLKVALIDFGYFLTREIASGIRALGHKAAKVHGNKNESAGDMLSRIVKMIIEYRPDFIITVNHLGFDEEGIIASFLNSIEMPSAIWYVDSPNLTVSGFNKNVSSTASLFLWDKTYIKDMKAMGFESVTYLPLATEGAVFRPLKLTHEEAKKYGAVTGFVGNSMVTPVMERLSKLPERLHPMIKKLSQMMSSLMITFHEAMRHLSNEEAEEIYSLTTRQSVDFEAAVLWQATMLYRLSCLQMLKDFQPCIYGDSGWHKFFNGSYTIRPGLRYYEDLPFFYNACRINFNTTSLQMPEAVNQRVFDVPACGGFLLTDHQEAIEEIFDVGREVITYRDRDEIADLVRFYLRNEGLRREIAKKGREKVLREHTYKHRLNSVIQVMRQRYKG